jgi:hypothetical protein
MALKHSGADAFSGECWRKRLSISTFALIMVQCGENGRQSASSVSHAEKAVRRAVILGKAYSVITLGANLAVLISHRPKGSRVPSILHQWPVQAK